ncbi:MAG: ABATE domain-containing protein [Alphaproteobacteria bacterium]|nr:ABATE domain-containing protein [Alphaproteobacteria bacterium]
MSEADRLQDRMRLVAAPPEDLCLVFANSRSWRPSDQPVEKLHSFADLMAWCRTAKSLDPASADQLRLWAQHNARVAAHLFDEAIATRETIYRLFSATADNAQPAVADVETLNRLLARTPGRVAVTLAAAGNRWRLPPAAPAVASLLAPVIWSAGDLLTGERLARVRLCANDKCRWLFLDDSKAGTRRWCAMRSCGNRAKAHRHYLRKTKPARAQAPQ